MTVQTFRSPPADSWATKENKQMKKLIVAAAIVCAAACSQAASFVWGNFSHEIDNWAGNAPIVNWGNPMYEDGMMYLYLGTVGYTAGGGFDLSSVTLVTSGGFDDTFGIYGKNGISGFSQSDLVDDRGGEAFTLILTESGKSLDAMADGDHFVRRTGTSEYYGTYVVFSDTNSIFASDWTTYSAIPEPTSGLLLLFGMAGLALKRKRA